MEIIAPRRALLFAIALLPLGSSGWAQAPAPATEHRSSTFSDLARLTVLGEAQLEREDPVTAFATFREILVEDPDSVPALLGLGRADLLLGRPEHALDLALRTLELAPDAGDAIALRVRALLRGRRFTEALAVSTAAVERGRADAAVLAAHASALFRLQRNVEAAAFYRRVVALQPDHAEAHLRLGSGLTAPCAVSFGSSFRDALDRLDAGELDAALRALRIALEEDPGNPVVHRLIGETLFLRKAVGTIACTSDEFRRVAELLPESPLDEFVAMRFMPDFAVLQGLRRDVAARVLGAFGSRLPTIVERGGGHDLLAADERTTDHPARSSLRGKRTFDGRVWDDVRGIGGLRAATGIEALDEAAVHGFDTLAHEVAHQVHLHGLRKRSLQVRIHRLYDRAMAEDRCLDYYAASNYAEYFAQGVEAFVSLVKRPTGEATHGHTRFELMRVDPELHALIAELVDVDPLSGDRDPQARAELLEACVGALCRAGLVDDARTAAQRMPAGPRRDAALARVRELTLDIAG